MQNSSENKFFSRDRNNLLLAAAIAAVVVLPVLIYGVPYGYDMPHHYQCALTYLDALKSGDFYPSWTLDRNLGYGALELRMYPPLSHYLLAIFELIFNDWHLATWANYTFWWMLGGIGVYLFAREFVKPSAALFASALFSVMPYRLSQLYLTFLYSELCAITILPFCFLFLTRILKETDPAGESKIFSSKNMFSLNVLGFAVAYAALILTHLPMTVIGTLSLGIYFFAQIRWNLKYLRLVVLQTAVGFIFGLSASSFFWLKVLQERFLMAKNDIYPEVFVNYQYNFLLTFIQNYDNTSFVVYTTVSVVYDAILFLTLFIILPVAVFGFFHKQITENYQLRSIRITLTATLFFTTVLSRPIWNILPLLSEVQFPWRFLGVVSMFGSITAATGFTDLTNLFQNKKHRPLALAIMGTVCIGSFFAVNQSVRGAYYKDSAELQDFVKDAGRKEGFTFWWTKFARREFIKNNIDKANIQNRDFLFVDWKPTERRLEIEAGNPNDLYIATFYHPNWQATVNGVLKEIRPAEDGGMIVFVNDEKSVIDLSFRETSAVKSGQWISGLTGLAILFLFIFALVKRRSLESTLDA